jgi:hypothetical protein
MKKMKGGGCPEQDERAEKPGMDNCAISQYFLGTPDCV